jgi:hypothetical protein
MDQKGYGWVPTPSSDPKIEQHAFPVKHGYASPPSPASATLEPFIQFPILDQGPAPSCVSNAFSHAIQLVDCFKGQAPVRPSRMFMWWHARNQAGDAKNYVGTWPSQVIRVSNALGRPAESKWEYDLTKWAQKPPPDVMIDGFDRRKADMSHLTGTGSQTFEQLKASICMGRPVIFGTAVWDWFQNVRGFSVLDPDKSGKKFELHCMCAVGYDPSSVITLNSWGPEFGEYGLCRLSWDYIAIPQTSDMVSIGL